jgi:hypothetical protein
MTLPRYEEWRLSFVLPDGDVKTGAFLEQLRGRLPDGVDAHRKGRRGIRLYADSRESIMSAETVALELLASHGIRCTLDRSVWNPGEERLQSPLLPVEPPRGPLPNAWSGSTGRRGRFGCGSRTGGRQHSSTRSSSSAMPRSSATASA